MPSVLQLFVDMVRLRTRPQDIPASDGLLLASVAAAAIASVVALRPFYPITAGAARVGLDLVLQYAIVFAALRASGRPGRFHQTFTAICGTGVIFALIAWPLYVILVDRDPADPLAALSVLLVLGTYIWAVVVTGHIFRHAFNVRMGVGVVIALLYVVLTTSIGETLLPPPELT